MLLVSTDPAHSTSDIFEGGSARERELQPDLSAIEIDADSEAARYIADVKSDIGKMFSPGVVRRRTGRSRWRPPRRGCSKWRCSIA